MFDRGKKLNIENRVVLITGGLALARKVKGKGGIPVCVDLSSEPSNRQTLKLDETVKSLNFAFAVIPAYAGIQCF